MRNQIYLATNADEEIHTSARNIALKSVESNARQLLLDAELLFDHGRYGRAAALAILAIEEVGKFYLFNWNMTKPEQTTRHHQTKQQIAVAFTLVGVMFNEMERAADAMGLQLKLLGEFNLADQKWLEVFETLNSNDAFMNNVASVVQDALRHRGLLLEAVNGTLSRIKELGFYVDLSNTNEILVDPNDARKEQAKECISFAKIAIARIIWR